MHKQQQILQAALRLFVEHGFHGTPTSRVAQEAGVSNGTLFNYYKTKEDLVVSLYNQVKDDLNRHLATDINPTASVDGLFRSIFIRSIYWGLDNPQAFLYIQQFNLSPHLTRLSAEVLLEQSRVYREFIERGVNEGVLKSMPTDLIYTLISSQLFGVFHYLIAHSLADAERHQTIQQSTDLLWDMLTD